MFGKGEERGDSGVCHLATRSGGRGKERGSMYQSPLIKERHCVYSIRKKTAAQTEKETVRCMN
jgi:hypothetical protein